MPKIIVSFLQIIKKRFIIIFLSIIVISTFLYSSFGNNNNSPDFSYRRTRYDAYSGKEVFELHLCPNLTSEDFIASKGILNSKIAVITPILNYKNYEDYIGIDTLQCYVNHFGYQLHLVNMTDNPRYSKLCNQTDHFFMRHCILSTFLEDNKDTIDYALIIDADIGVINPCHTIQEYIDPEESVEVVFYERYYNHEISAASYFVRNSEYSRKFMHFWADYFYRLPQSFHGTDNGAIHQVFMELHFNDEKQKMQCYNMWNSSRGFDDLFAYQACTKNALNISSTLFVNGTIRLLRKLTPGWVRDGWLTGTKWAPQDFMFHGWKKSKLNV
jgi:hypothetical protein